MIPSNSKSSETVPIYKSRRFQPIFYSKLTTSTLVNHQRLKRIKGLLGYSEEFKDNIREYKTPQYRLKPLKSRDYRKARELDLEIFNAKSRLEFLEKFLKVQTNLRIIRIRFAIFWHSYSENTKPVIEIFGKMSRINRIQVDFNARHQPLDIKNILERVRATRKLANLKELAITKQNQEMCGFSVPLFLVGFDYDKQGAKVVDHMTIEKLMKKNRKIERIDTIQLSGLFRVQDRGALLEALAFLISKLPNLREFGIEFSGYNEKDITIENILKVLDALLKKPNLEILTFKEPETTNQFESIITHPVFQAKSLKKVHLSCSPFKNMSSFRNIPRLYEFSTPFYSRITRETVREMMEEFKKMANLRRLRLFLFLSDLSEKQAGDLLHSLCGMSLLEELDLWIHTDEKKARDDPLASKSLGNEVIELPRLQKLRLYKREASYSSDKSMIQMAEFFGKCSRLKEMTFDVETCGISSWKNLSQKLLESLGKLKQLQDIKLNMKTSLDYNGKVERKHDKATVTMFADWIQAFDSMENLQDFQIDVSLIFQSSVLENFRKKIAKNPKYRFYSIPGKPL